MAGFIDRLFAKKEQVPVVAKRDVEKVERRRRFEAAQFDSTLSSWVRSLVQDINSTVETDLRTLQSRSQDAAMNDPHITRYLQFIEDMVVGPQGIRLKMATLRSDLRTPDAVADMKIEEQWEIFCKDVTTCGMHMRDMLSVCLTTVATDGEVFLVKRRGRDFGRYFFQLQIFESKRCPLNYNAEPTNSNNVIRSGIEYNQYGRPVAYYFSAAHPKNRYQPVDSGTDLIRVEARDVIHLYDKKRVSQGRGYPWTTAALKPLAHLKDFRNSELVAARVSAAKMGFYKRPRGEDGGLGNLPPDESQPEIPSTIRQSLSPGSFDVLPEDYEVHMFDPTHPNTSFAEFEQSILTSVAASLGISALALTTNVKGTSYATGRIGRLDEAETLKNMQQFLSDHLLEPVFGSWLMIALDAGLINLPANEYPRWNRPHWRARTWPWVDPSKEATMIQMKLNHKLASRTDVARDLGRVYDDVLAEIAEENRKAAALGITLEEVDEVMKKELLNGAQIPNKE